MRAAMKAIWTAILLAALAAPAAAAEDCKLVKIVSFDMRADVSGTVSVAMKIGGRPVNMLVDTGGIFTGISQSTVKALGLEDHPLSVWYRTVVYGGTVLKRYVTAANIEYGPFVQPVHDFVVMPDGSLPAGVDGLLGPDILHGFDVDFDFAAGKLNLFSPEHCPGHVVYWTQSPVAVLDLLDDGTTLPHDHRDLIHPLVWTRLDGEAILALVDTGTSNTTFSLELAESKFDFDKASPNLKEITEGTYVWPFKSLGIAGLEVQNPHIDLIPNKTSGEYGHTPIILGMNVLRRLHLYLSYKEHKLYVSPASQH